MADKPRTIAAAKRAGSKYYYDKDGNKKLAVTAEELKASGMTLRQWANKAEGKSPKGATAAAGSKPAPKRPAPAGSTPAPKRPADKTTTSRRDPTGRPPSRSASSRTTEKPMTPDQKRRADLLQAVKDFFKSEYDK